MSYQITLKSERHVEMAKHCRRYGFTDSVRYHEYFADAWRRAEEDGRASSLDFVPEPMPKPFEPVSMGLSYELADGDGDDPPGCWNCGAPVSAIDQLCSRCEAEQDEN